MSSTNSSREARVHGGTGFGVPTHQAWRGKDEKQGIEAAGTGFMGVALGAQTHPENKKHAGGLGKRRGEGGERGGGGRIGKGNLRVGGKQNLHQAEWGKAEPAPGG